MARSDPQVNIRMPAELKASLEEASADSKRSLNAEIIARLQRSFEAATETSPLITAAVAEALAEVTEYANKHGVTPDEALTGLVAAALNRESEPVYFFVIDKEMKMSRLKEILGEAVNYVPDDGTVIVQARGMTKSGFTPSPPKGK